MEPSVVRQSRIDPSTTFVGEEALALLAVDREGVFNLLEGPGLAALGIESEKLEGRLTFDADGVPYRLAEDVRRALTGEKFSSVMDGGETSLEWRYHPMWGADGSVLGAVGFAVGADGRKRAEQALVESEERYRTLVESIREGIAFVGAEGWIIEYCNQAYAQVLGLSPAELSGRIFFEFLDEREKEKATHQSGLRAEGVGSTYEILATAADGQRKHLSCGAIPFSGRAARMPGRCIPSWT